MLRSSQSEGRDSGPLRPNAIFHSRVSVGLFSSSRHSSEHALIKVLSNALAPIKSNVAWTRVCARKAFP